MVEQVDAAHLVIYLKVPGQVFAIATALQRMKISTLNLTSSTSGHQFNCSQNTFVHEISARLKEPEAHLVRLASSE